MLSMSKKTLGFGAAGFAAASILATSLPMMASAEPTFTPGASDYVGVGSDTTQNVVNAFANKWNAKVPTPSSKWANFDAFLASPPTPDNIVLRSTTGCDTPIARSTTAGSSAGIASLLNDVNGCIDYARSSRGKNAATDSNLLFIAFARDGVTWASFPVTSGTVTTTGNLTTANLTSIYNCTVTNWKTIKSSLPSNPIEPYAPQSSSGTRKFFLTAIGVPTPGSCVRQPTIPLEENNGVALQSAVSAAGDNANLVVAPYSIAVFTAQKNGAPGVVDNRGGMTLRNIDGLVPVRASTGRLNPSFAPNFLRFVYNVVKPDLTTGTISTRMRKLFGTSAQGGFVCNQTTIIQQQGFGSIGTLCGSITS